MGVKTEYHPGIVADITTLNGQNEQHQKSGVNHVCSWMVSSSCSVGGLRRVALVMSHELRKGRIAITTNSTYYP
jgi:hypothetical protein